MLGRGDLKRFEDFEFSGCQYPGEARCRFLHPAARLCRRPCDVWAHLVDLDVIAVQFGRKAPGLKFFCSLVELRDAALKLHAHPEVFILIEAEGKNARRHFGLQSGILYSVTLPVLGSSFPRICSPKLAYHAIPCESTITS